MKDVLLSSGIVLLIFAVIFYVYTTNYYKRKSVRLQNLITVYENQKNAFTIIFFVPETYMECADNNRDLVLLRNSYSKDDTLEINILFMINEKIDRNVKKMDDLKKQIDEWQKINKMP